MMTLKPTAGVNEDHSIKYPPSIFDTIDGFE